jgi:hypothetical protein
VPADELTAMVEICDCVRASKMSFPKKARERLAQFDDKGVERRFWTLPETIWTDAQKHDRKGRKTRAADLAKYALALAIAFDKPLRVTNLAHLYLKLDFEHDRHCAIIGIRIEGERTTKNAPIIEGAPPAEPDIHPSLIPYVAGFVPEPLRFLTRCWRSRLTLLIFIQRVPRSISWAISARHVRSLRRCRQILEAESLQWVYRLRCPLSSKC